MDTTRLLDGMPLWLLYFATLGVVALSIEVGYRLGSYRRRQAEKEKETAVGTIVASTLGLLAFLLAFTFGLAASRFDARRFLVVDEANAIGTAYLRAKLLPEPHAAQLQQLLREYIDARLDAPIPGHTAAALARSGELQDALWAELSAQAATDTRPLLTSLFAQALNAVIDIHSKRVMYSLHNRIPELVWLVLYLVTIFSMVSLGYQEGIAGSRRSLAVGLLAVTFSLVIWLIADLDRPHEGLLRVDQRSMRDLRDSLEGFDHPPAPAAEGKEAGEPGAG